MATSNHDELTKELEQFKEMLIEWKRTNKPALRGQLNQRIPKVSSIMAKAGEWSTVTFFQPPAAGGQILKKVDPFNLIFDPLYGYEIAGTITDMIDRTIGVIESGDYDNIVHQQEEIAKTVSNKKVFIVHGHDEGAKQAVARFIEKLDLKPIILHEHPNQGLTIIEKFEKYSDVSYAVVLLTPDDRGAACESPGDLNPRARQNVIFELGYFFGRLGRTKVCALLKGDLERPSDSDGICYISLDPTDGWKNLLAKEMKEAGLDFDMNKAITSE